MKHLVLLFVFSFTFSHLAFSFNFTQQQQQRIEKKSVNIYQKVLEHKSDLRAIKRVINDYVRKNHESLTYNEARRYLMGTIHLAKDDNGHFIKDVYCEKKYRKNGIGKNRIPNHNIINTEHTWPKSRFNKSLARSVQESDLHHLYPSDHQLNSSRSSFRFGEVSSDERELKCDQSHLGRLGHVPSKKDNNGWNAGSLYFEPPHSHKGNVARALFYFAIRYNLTISSSEEYFLRKWHREDPVDDLERKRNMYIEQFQGNRNPFIDYPQIVDEISDF